VIPAVKKIVVIGPESTGKSTLCEQLAQHYNAMWCPEFAREYLLTNGKDYAYEDLLTIAKGQLALEDEFMVMLKGQSSIVNKKSSGNSQFTSRWPSGHNSLLFIDTDMYVMKVWCEFAFGKCHRFILDQVVARKYDLYLLCNTDLPWTMDELREYPDLETRRTLYNMYKDILLNQAVPWIDISGNNEERLVKAIEAVDRLTKAG
jgi:NadR type nicotinamide-nucleotide adenylyltransferase